MHFQRPPSQSSSAGVNSESKEAAVALYSGPSRQGCPFHPPGWREAAKLLVNIYRAVNIALVNELKMTFDRMIHTISGKSLRRPRPSRSAFQAFYPGPGLGGHCIPLDPFFLSWKAAEYACGRASSNCGG
jgi:UDP-N-acetyl-D-glucosamine dehydrogenase